jgi:hypothetical protein
MRGVGKRRNTDTTMVNRRSRAETGSVTASAIRSYSGSDGVQASMNLKDGDLHLKNIPYASQR